MSREGLWLKKVQAFRKGDVMVFFQEAIFGTSEVAAAAAVAIAVLSWVLCLVNFCCKSRRLKSQGLVVEGAYIGT